ncbi:pantoate--beta-alanine ligase [Paenibacillus hemerocallicola]|uniref:Pantothenate synthetase n=1 Tax=Paenibacillus hemerocallicola TaxID=1172614 RepID=A0A5C4T3B6_9BACL|nr:pantoate--beta-alanine ligase [Paenibacillus hemerocallicola]TNJ63564.1 pantoate--beta-alanine ligase [Paenibacillus hemerocallicola]
MESIATINELRAKLRAARREIEKTKLESTVGFMPTLGYMHEGHMSLIRQARRECDIVVVSIFVNPLQFGQNEDFDKYPRNTERDLQLAAEAGADFVFVPSVKEMYPTPIKTSVVVKQITDVLCGASRPGHFEGVATVVSKLFQIVQPDRAYFGMKDAQQVAVIEQFTTDLNMPVHIVRCETLREPDGLAMSSRNVYLNEEERKQALVLSESLGKVAGWVAEQGMTMERLERNIRVTIEAASLARIDYVEIRTYPGLDAVTSMDQWNGSEPILVALAVKFGSTRLIDNRIFFS